MGLLDRLRGWPAELDAALSDDSPSGEVLPPVERAAPAAVDVGSHSIAQILGTGEVPRRGTAALLRVYDQSPAVRSAAERVAFSVASSPWGAYITGPGRKASSILSELHELRSQPREYRSRIKAMVEGQDLREAPREHPAAKLLRRPNGLLRRLGTLMVQVAQLDLAGETWIYSKDQDSKGRPMSLLPVPPSWVDMQRDGRLLVTWPSGQQEPLDATRLQRVFYPDPSNPYGRGTGLGRALSDEIDADEYAAKLAAARFRNKGVPDVLIKMAGASNDVLRLMQEDMRNKAGGVRQGGKPYLVNNDIDVKQLAGSLVDLDLVKLREFEREVIRSTWGVPPEVLGLTGDSNRATAHQAKDSMARYVMIPRLELFREWWQEELVPLFDDPERFLVLYENPIPEDWDFRLEAAKAAPWAKTRDEWRRLTGDEPLGGTAGAVILVPAQLVPTTAARLAEEAEGPEDDDPEPPDGERAAPPVVEPDSALPGPILSVIRQQDPRVDAVVQALRAERLSRPTSDLWSRQLRRWIARTAAELGAEISFELLNPLIAQHVSTLSGTRIAGINETTRNAIRTTLTEGVRAGESSAVLAKRVKESLAGASKTRAVTIARTEVVHSANWGTYNAHALSGLVSKRQWVATPDGRTRDEHWQMNGQIRGITEPFEAPGGQTAMFPGGFGIAHLDINERCTTVAVIDDPLKEAELLAVWKRFDQALLPWERMAIKAFREGFKAQERDALAALERAFGSAAA